MIPPELHPSENINHYVHLSAAENKDIPNGYVFTNAFLMIPLGRQLTLVDGTMPILSLATFETFNNRSGCKFTYYDTIISSSLLMIVLAFAYE